jgi:hypothetical protein
MWQFFAMIAAQIESTSGLSSAEADDLWQWMQSKD